MASFPTSALLFFLCFSAASAGFQATVLLNAFSDPGNTVLNGDRCDANDWFGPYCDMRFVICVDQNSHLTQCSTQQYSTGVIAYDTNNVTFTQKTYGNWTNPSVVPFSGSVTPVYLKMAVYDYNFGDGRDLLIDAYALQLSYGADGRSHQVTYTHPRSGNTPTILNMQVNIACTGGYTGYYCNNAQSTVGPTVCCQHGYVHLSHCHCWSGWTGYCCNVPVSTWVTDYYTTGRPATATTPRISSSIRLNYNGNTNLNYGRVEVYHNGAWGTVCDDIFDQNIHAAEVVCAMLGYPRPGAVCHNRAYYGQGSGQIWLDNVQCRGTEMDIYQCRHNAWGNHNCQHSEDVGVWCVPEAATPLQLNNRGSWGGSSGTVQVFHRGQWGTVCDDYFGQPDAEVVCAMLGYSRYNATAYSRAYFGQGGGSILLDDLQCSGNETDINDCTHPSWGYNNCQHSEDAGVSCGGLALDEEDNLVEDLEDIEKKEFENEA